MVLRTTGFDTISSIFSKHTASCILDEVIREYGSVSADEADKDDPTVQSDGAKPKSSMYENIDNNARDLSESSMDETNSSIKKDEL